MREWGRINVLTYPDEYCDHAESFDEMTMCLGWNPKRDAVWIFTIWRVRVWDSWSLALAYVLRDTSHEIGGSQESMLDAS